MPQDLNIMRNKRPEKREIMYIPKYFAIQDEKDEVQNN